MEHLPIYQLPVHNNQKSSSPNNYPPIRTLLLRQRPLTIIRQTSPTKTPTLPIPCWDPYYPVNCPQYVDPRTLIPKKKKKPIPKKKKERLIPKKKIDDLPQIKDPEDDEPRVVIPEGGNLVCAVNDICGNEKIAGTRQFSQPNYCNPTTDSDVPGPIQDLCYNSRVLQTFYPRNRYVMTNSGNKFPTGYKFSNTNGQ